MTSLGDDEELGAEDIGTEPQNSSASTDTDTASDPEQQESSASSDADTLFDRNSSALQRAQEDGDVGGQATGPDTGPMPDDQRLGGGGLGGAPGGGNAQDGPNVEAINRRNE